MSRRIRLDSLAPLGAEGSLVRCLARSVQQEALNLSPRSKEEAGMKDRSGSWSFLSFAGFAFSVSAAFFIVGIALEPLFHFPQLAIPPNNPQVILPEPCSPPPSSLRRMLECAKMDLRPGRLAFEPK